MKRKNRFGFVAISLILLACLMMPLGLKFGISFVQNENSAVAVDGDDDIIEIAEDNENLERDIQNMLNENPQQELVNNNAQPAQNNNANANQNAKGKMDVATKVAIATHAAKTAVSVAEMFVDMANAGPDQIDYIKHSFNIVRNAANLVATVLAGNPAAGVICDAVFQIIDMIGKIGDHSQSELQMMEARLNDQFDIVNENIEDVKNSIQNLSKEIEEGFNKVMKQMDESFEAYAAKTKVNDFIYSDTGNFSYNTFRKYLYGNGDLGYYISLYDSIQKGESEEIIEEKYNQLYDILLGNHNGQESCMDMLYENYLVASNERPTILKLYYEYLKSNQSYLSGTTPTLASLDFAQNVYADYYFAANIIKTVHTYQVTQLVRNALNSGEDISTLRYEYRQGTYNTIEDINRKNAVLDQRLEALDRQIMLDLATILELDDSYAVQDVNGRFRYEKDKTNENFANLASGQTLYLNQITDYFSQMFGLNSNKFEYTFVDVNGNTIDTATPGIYYVDGQVPAFAAIVTYNNNDIYAQEQKADKIYPVYSINFRVNDNSHYAGGLGTEQYPYIISSPEQFGLLYKEDNLNKNYLLINNLDFSGKTIITSLGESTVVPLGTNLKPFSGYLNGGGYSIKNLKVVLQDKFCGLFAKISSSGIVSSLTLENCTFTASNNDLAKISVGAFAAENNGTIVNCHTLNGTISAKRDSDYNNENVNKAITLYTGGLVAENNGTVSYCSVKNARITADSKRDYSANGDTSNKNTVYAGGLIAVQSNYAKLNNCYVGSDVSVNATGKGYCHAGFSLRRPYVDVYAAGIVAYADKHDGIKELFTDISLANINITTETYNGSWSGGSRNTNVKTYRDQYIANKSLSSKLKSKDNKQYIFPTIIDYDYDVRFEDEEGQAVNVEYTCVAEHFDYSNMIFGLREKTTQKEYNDLKYTIVANYGFNSKNESKTEDVSRQAIILVYVKEASRTFIVPVTYKVLKNSPEKLELGKVNMRDFAQKDEVITGSVAELLDNTVVYVVYQNGEKITVSGNVAQATIDCSELGMHGLDDEKCGEVSYDGLSCKFETVVYCDNHDFEEQVFVTERKLQEDNMYFVSGYIIDICSNCGKQEIRYFNKAFETEIVNVVEQNCLTYGYTGDRVVVDPDGYFQSQVVVQHGERLPLLPHNYDYSNVANIDYYRDASYHYCTECDHAEAHIFKTIENNDKVILCCVECGYISELEINSREKIKKLPRVVVSDAYALEGQNIVKVFVELHANTGITAANFTVKFDSRLTLVDYDLGNILNNSSSIDAFRVYEDHINVVLAQTNVDTSTDGTILELTFKTPVDAAVSDKYAVEILNKGGSDKFTDCDGNKTDFIAYNGKIYVVEHLPGDVNNDGKTDLFDAVIISKYIVLDEKEQADYLLALNQGNAAINIHYADVTLDGSIDISDVVQILRYTVGGFEQTIVANEFEVVLNYDDGSAEEHVILVNYEFGTGVYKDLPELKREGFKFIGWFTDFGGNGEKIANGDRIVYRKEQYKQTLYAYFEPNIVHFDGNGAEGAKPDTRHPNQVNFDINDDYGVYFTKNIYVTLNGNGVFEDSTVVLEQNFLGWSLTPNGEVEFTINSALDLSKSGYDGVGDITLYAVWAPATLTPNVPTRDGYIFLCWTKADRVTSFWSGEENIELYQNITLYARWQKTRYTFKYNGNNGVIPSGAVEYTEDVIRDRDNYATPLRTNEFVREGYAFLGWSTDKDSETAQLLDNATLTQDQTIALMRDVDADGYVKLYAIWKGNTYTVIFHPNAQNIKGENDDYPFVDSDITTDELERQTLVYGKNDTLINPNYNCPDDHYYIAGWELDQTQDIVQFEVGVEKSFNMTSHDGAEVHVYAVWRGITSRVQYKIGGYVVKTDIVHYYNSYTFRTHFKDVHDDFNNYEIYEYISITGDNWDSSVTHISLGGTIDKWMTQGDITVECAMISRNVNFTVEDGTVTGVSTYADTKILIIPRYVYVNSRLNQIRAISKGFLQYSNGLGFLETLVIDNGIEEIGDNAFRYSKVKNIYMASVNKIGRSAFSGCEQLEMVVFPDRKVDLDYYVFDESSTFDIYYLGLNGNTTSSKFWGQDKVKHEYYYLEDPTDEQIAEGKYWRLVDGEIAVWDDLT